MFLSFEKNLIVGYKGAARINEYKAKHKLDVCIVYGVDPKIVSRIEGDSEFFWTIPKVRHIQQFVILQKLTLASILNLDFL